MRHSSFTAIYDACVLHPAPLRDFLIRLGLSGRFRAHGPEAELRSGPERSRERPCDKAAVAPEMFGPPRFALKGGTALNLSLAMRRKLA